MVLLVSLPIMVTIPTARSETLGTDQCCDLPPSFPNPPLCYEANRDVYAAELATIFELNHSGPRINPLHLNLFRGSSETDQFDSLFTDGYRECNYEYDGGEINLQYIETTIADRGLISSIEVTLWNSSIVANSSEEMLVEAKNCTSMIGVPSDNLTVVSQERLPGYLPSGATTIILSENVTSIPVAGCNLIGVTFDDYSGRLVSLQALIFFNLPLEFNVSGDQALEIANSSALSNYSQYPGISSSRIIGLRFQPVLYVEPISPPYQNQTINSTIEIHFAYEVLLKFQSEPRDLLVVVDSNDGEVLYQRFAYAPVSEIPVQVIIGISIIVFIGLLIEVSPEFAILIFGSVLVPLFMRIRGAEILNSFNRGRIFQYISSQPGSSYSDIRAALGIGNGTLTYHLTVLEKLELISSRREGRVRRYFVQGSSAKQRTEIILGSTELKILDRLEEAGEMTSIEISRQLDISRQRSHYNLKLLSRKGLVERIGEKWKLTESNPHTS